MSLTMNIKRDNPTLVTFEWKVQTHIGKKHGQNDTGSQQHGSWNGPGSNRSKGTMPSFKKQHKCRQNWAWDNSLRAESGQIFCLHACYTAMPTNICNAFSNVLARVKASHLQLAGTGVFPCTACSPLRSNRVQQPLLMPKMWTSLVKFEWYLSSQTPCWSTSLKGNVLMAPAPTGQGS